MLLPEEVHECVALIIQNKELGESTIHKAGIQMTKCPLPETNKKHDFKHPQNQSNFLKHGKEQNNSKQIWQEEYHFKPISKSIKGFYCSIC